MGLDMYLLKAKRFEDATPKTVIDMQEYFDWLERDEKYKNYSMKKWCGIDESTVRKDLVGKYKDEYKMRYCTFDIDKKFPRKMINQMIADWRKANQIHAWFVDNVCGGIDDCTPYEVEEYQLEDLLSICKTIKANVNLIDGVVVGGYNSDGPITYQGKVIDDPKLCERLLPTQSGFFFGSTDYDEYYMEDIDYTIYMLERALREIDWDNEMVWYEASW